jgi:ribosomal protein S18 acetylase RimI-like enzyme
MAGDTRQGNGRHATGPACVPLADADVESAARLYTEVFLADEPTSHRHALDPARFLPYARVYVRSLVKKDLSFLIRDKTTGEPAGFIFCFDFTEDPADEGDEMREFIAHFREAVAMIGELEDRHLDRQRIAPGEVLHIFQIGVSRQARGLGMAQAMIRRALSHAKDRGFRQAVADCTGPASQRAFEGCGFRERGNYPYAEFSMDGVRFFAGLDGGISLMAKDL